LKHKADHLRPFSAEVRTTCIFASILGTSSCRGA